MSDVRLKNTANVPIFQRQVADTAAKTRKGRSAQQVVAKGQEIGRVFGLSLRSK